MEQKVRQLIERLKSVEELLGQPEVLSDQKKYKELTQEYSQLASLKDSWNEYQITLAAIKENQELLKLENDQDMIAVIEEELTSLNKLANILLSRIHSLIVPPDPRDDRNIILEIRAGTGGDEAALFVGNCVRMYKNFCENMNWKYEQISCTDSEIGGYKEYIMGISGKKVFRNMQFEAGTHRVQRVPETETQGRVHTSAITIAILLEPDEKEVTVEDKDLRIETYRASGAGGQHVNTTDSAVRITHIPTNTVVCCQDERSQLKNKERALRLLKAKVAEEDQRKKAQEISSLRSSQVGSGDRSERIRTYNFPQNRLTDHRINLTIYNLDKVMEGYLEEISNSLVSHYYQKKLHEYI
jgi:peptide chain release factor 1